MASVMEKTEKTPIGLLCGMMALNGGNPRGGHCLGLLPSPVGLYFGNATLQHYPTLYLLS